MGHAVCLIVRRSVSIYFLYRWLGVSAFASLAILATLAPVVFYITRYANPIPVKRRVMMGSESERS